MKHFLLITAATIIPALAMAKGGDFGAYIKSGMLFNTPQMRTEGGGKAIFTKVKNTWQESVGVNYNYMTKQGVLLFGAVEGGYEQYKVKLGTPTDAYTTAGAQQIDHDINTKIYYASVQVGVGYKFTKTKLQPEVRIGEVLQIPMNSKNVNSEHYEFTDYGKNYMSFLKVGEFGSKPDLYNNIYVGADVFHGKKIINAIKLGLQFQQRILFKQNLSNYLAVKYYDANGSPISTERFNGQHMALSLIVGVVF